ncbi:MAG: hypothetical protein ABW066_10240 [Sedimenticola sp.]
MNTSKTTASWAKLIELAILFSLGALLFTLYTQGYLDRILGNTLSLWFFGLIVTIVLLVETFAFTIRVVDVHFWSWLTTGLGMLGTVLGFSLALGGIDVKALHDPATLSAEIGQFLKTVSFAIDTTLIGLSAALVMEAMNKIREMFSGQSKPERTALEEE